MRTRLSNGYIWFIYGYCNSKYQKDQAEVTSLFSLWSLLQNMASSRQKFLSNTALGQISLHYWSVFIYDLPRNVFSVCVCLSLLKREAVKRTIYNSVSHCWTHWCWAAVFTVAAFSAAFFLITFLQIGLWDAYIFLVCLMYTVEPLVQLFRLLEFVIQRVGELYFWYVRPSSELFISYCVL